MRGVGLILLFIVVGMSIGQASLSSTEGQELNLDEAVDFGFAPFNSCGPWGSCNQLPNLPYAWPFMPSFMGFPMFTPFGARGNDWNDWGLSQQSGWQDWNNDMGNDMGDEDFSFDLHGILFEPNPTPPVLYNYRRSVGRFPINRGNRANRGNWANWESWD
jgi:hypothetical protein